MNHRNNKPLPYNQGVVNTKNHPELKFGQVVIIIESTQDLYRVRVHPKASIMIISKEDLTIIN